MVVQLVARALRQSVQTELVPLRATTEAFLARARSSDEYNQYLESISHIPFRTAESTHTVKAILEHADKTQSEISTHTYTRLLRPAFAPVALLAYLHHRLVRPDTSAPVPLLLSFLTAYSKLANPAKAAFFYARIHAHADTTPPILQHASTLLLAAQPSQRAAYRVLLDQPPTAYDPHPFNTSASFHVLSKDLSIPPRQLIQSFHLLARQPHSRLLHLYTSLINGLILRKRYRIAAVFFNKLLKITNSCPLTLDIPSLSAGLNALTRAGCPDLAFQLLQSHYPRALLSLPKNPSSFHNPSLPIITFLTALNRISRPDISTLLFFLYPALYSPNDPPPNSVILNLLLQASRTAIKMDLRIQSAKSIVPDNLKRIIQYVHSRSSKHQKKPLTSLLSRLNLRTSTLIHQITSSLGDNLSYQHLISDPLNQFGAHPPPSVTPDSPPPHPRLHASNLILTHLGHPSRGGLRHFLSSSGYKNIPSGTWARVVFLQVLAGIGPHLHTVRSPVTSYIPNPSQQEQEEEKNSPSLDSFTHLFQQQKTAAAKQDWIPYAPLHFYNPTLWDNLLLAQQHGKKKKKTMTTGTTTTIRSKQPCYPSIIPNNSNFFNYLILLGLSNPLRPVTLFPNGRVSEVPLTGGGGGEDEGDGEATILPQGSQDEAPLVLAWMRNLDIQPSKSTLAVALVMWGEVCARVDASASSAVIQDTGEGPGGGGQMHNLKPGERQYLFFVSYLREWVGEGRLPHWRTLENWRIILRRMRGLDGEGDEEEDLERLEEEGRKRRGRGGRGKDRDRDREEYY